MKFSMIKLSLKKFEKICGNIIRHYRYDYNFDKFIIYSQKFSIKQQNEKTFQDTIFRVKFPVESKSELRIGVQNKGKQENRKETKISVLDQQKSFFHNSRVNRRLQGRFLPLIMKNIVPNLCKKA